MEGIKQQPNQVSTVLGTLYDYDKLPHDDSFRHLILQPSTDNEPLECSLFIAPLPQITFEAISYVWGKDIKNHEIACDGRIIKITENLYNVLQRLWLPDAPRKLWADGICINQDDAKEKGHQVAIMGQIYRSAKHVLIYLGPGEGGHGPQLCSLIDKVSQMIEESFRHIDMSQSKLFPYLAADNPLLSDSRWHSMYHLVKNKWFRRGWVVREAAFAKVGEVI